LQDVHLKDTASAPQLWQPSDIACAIDGAATLQAIWLGRDNELASKPWIGPVASTARRVAMSELWHALAAHAAPRFSAWARPAMATTHRRLVESVGEWAPTLDALPRTLIHHDFNPRNICFRHQAGVPALVAYDWELATVGVPQRDLAELLCFVLPEDAGRDQIEAWIERHRRRLQDEAGVTLDADDWKLGFAASMFDLLLSRLPIYAIVRRVRRQEFLPRVVRNWWRIYSSVTADSL
jgi:aminoglycoside phosphotransferase (APT) family kinase protein